MARVPLEELVLQIHLLGLGPAAEFLARVIEPPPAKSITGAVSQLQAIGALTPEEAFTPLGNLPICSLMQRPLLCVNVLCLRLFVMWDYRDPLEVCHLGR